MENNHVSAELKGEAISLGLCGKWKRGWSGNEDTQTLIDKYFEGLDFPMKHHWPSNSFIKSNFEKELLWKNNILVDDSRSLLNPKEAVILGNSVSTVRVNGSNISVVYIRDNSTVRITAKNKSFVIVHLFENSKIDIEVQDKPDVLVLKHSTNATVNAPDGVKVKERL